MKLSIVAKKLRTLQFFPYPSKIDSLEKQSVTANEDTKSAFTN